VEQRNGRAVRASVRGDSSEVHAVEHRDGTWSRSCPALGAFSHVRALQLVVVVVRPGPEP
jgi:hypothetical protein